MSSNPSERIWEFEFRQRVPSFRSRPLLTTRLGKTNLGVADSSQNELSLDKEREVETRSMGWTLPKIVVSSDEEQLPILQISEFPSLVPMGRSKSLDYDMPRRTIVEFDGVLQNRSHVGFMERWKEGVVNFLSKRLRRPQFKTALGRRGFSSHISFGIFHDPVPESPGRMEESEGGLKVVMADR